MELKEILSFLKKHSKVITIGSMLGAIIAIAAYFLFPPKYYASGSLFIRRTIYPYSDNHFTYEGYYSQQAAMFYANSVVGLIESEDVLSQALTSMGIAVDEKSLMKYARKIRTIKSGPQLVGVVVKGNNENETKQLWQAITDITTKKLDEINQRGDPFMSIAKVLDEPIMKKDYRDVYLFTIVGLTFGFLLSSFYLALKKQSH